jgi:hypothetical protein
LSSYSHTEDEAFGTGDGATKTFSYTLSEVTDPKTAMYPSITDGLETFVDDRDGNMVGNRGGTGTVNYATGKVSVTFNAAPANSAAITCSYYTENAISANLMRSIFRWMRFIRTPSRACVSSTPRQALPACD